MEIDFDDGTILIDHKQNIDIIIDGKLFLGSSRGALDKKYLVELGVKNILICGSDLRKFFPKSYNYKIINIVDKDDEDVYKYFAETIEFIENNQPVYVHCRRGISRSATIVIAYLMWKMKLKFEEAYEFLRARRKIVCPNNGFIAQLKKFEENIINNNYVLSS
jgi:hypothetical protein